MPAPPVEKNWRPNSPPKSTIQPHPPGASLFRTSTPASHACLGAGKQEWAYGMARCGAGEAYKLKRTGLVGVFAEEGNVGEFRRDRDMVANGRVVGVDRCLAAEVEHHSLRRWA